MRHVSLQIFRGVADEMKRKLLTDTEQIGSYRIEFLIGEGGMGTVYRALDTKLNRPVAIKFLSAELADAAARRRFQREAQIASSLNHPHILTVHDAGEFEGRQYLVTEFIDGGTLKDWIRAEKRTWREIVELLTGVADGLAAAHAEGILHRDIKPTNILVARNGYAKVADFGLAKLAESAPDDPTRLSEELTRPHAVVGTLAYMSPEQASGGSVDTRGDIFSFGVVLYEMLAGHKPFEAATDLGLIQAIIHRTPQPLPGSVPAALRIAVEKALEKDRKERYQSMRDLVVDLRHSARQTTDTMTAVSERKRRAWARIGAVGLAVALATGIFFWRMDRVPPGPIQNEQLRNSAVSTPTPNRVPLGPIQNEQLRNSAVSTPTPTLSSNIERKERIIPPDFKTLLWVHDASGNRQITSEGNAFLPSFSHDGKKLYYLFRRARPFAAELWVANLETGQRQRLLPDFLVRHYTISADGERVVFVVGSETENLHLVWKPDAPLERFRYPVWWAALNGRSAPRQLASDGQTAFFGTDGDVIFLGQDKDTYVLFRVKEDGSELPELIPTPRFLGRQISFVPSGHSVSPDGKWVVVASPTEGMPGAVLVYSLLGGSPTLICDHFCLDVGGFFPPPPVNWSPDGKFLYMNFKGAIYAIPLPVGQALPPIPAVGLTKEDVIAWPGTRLIGERVFPGPNPSIYAFTRVSVQ